MSALESLPKPRSIRSTPIHKDHAPAVVCIVDPSGIEAAATVIATRVRRTKRTHGVGSYLFIDDTMAAYVLAETQSITHTWLREPARLRHLVACYAPLAGQGLTATLAGITEDVACHLADLERTRG